MRPLPTRREFFTRTTVGVTALALLKSRPGRAQTRSGMFISLPPWAVARGVGWPEQAQLAARVGYGGIDWSFGPAREAGVEATRALLAELNIVPTIVNLPMAGGGMLSVGDRTIEIIHTPGHTMGSICLYVREEKVLFTGDTALGLGTVAISPPPSGDMGLYLESLRMLQRYDVELMLPGHGRPVEDVEAKLQELIDHRLEREQQVFKLLRAGKSKPRSMLGAIYPELDRRLIPMALRQIEAHLAKLAEEGVVEDLGGGEWKLLR